MRKALRSADSFSLTIILILGLPSAITLPLSEGASQSGVIQLKIAISIASLVVVAVLAFGFRRLTLLRAYRWWMTFPLSFLLGAGRGSTLWFLSDIFAIDQQPLIERVLLAGFTWVVLLPIASYFYYLFRHSYLENQLLRKRVAQAESEYGSLRQERDWLMEARVSGLDEDLAKTFVGLVAKLNEVGRGPAAHREIAKELRKISREQVRPASIKLYQQRWNPRELVAEFAKTVPSPLLVALSYTGSVTLNQVRLGNFGPQLLTFVIPGIAVLMTLLLARHFWIANHLVWFSAASSTVATGLIAGQSDSELLVQGLSAGIWSQSLAAAAALIGLIWARQNRFRQQLGEILETANFDIQSIALELEAMNAAIAKYLHAILQTRLMSYAMRLESGEISDAQLRDLSALLTSPMREFEYEETALEPGLAKIAEEWEPVLAIEYRLCKLRFFDLDSKALQIIREAISNSVRHGLADRVAINIEDGDHREITIRDNGIGPTAGNAGLGTIIFEQYCSNWNITRNSDGSATFSCTI